MRKAVYPLAIVLMLLPAQLPAADARELFQRGSSALAAGKPGEAIRAFDEAYKEQPSPSLLFWLGEAHRAAGHNKRAAAYYRRYLRQEPDGPKAAEAKAALAELKPKPGERKTKGPRKLSLADIDLKQAAPPPLPLPAAPPLPAAETAKPPELALPLPQPAAAPKPEALAAAPAGPPPTLMAPAPAPVPVPAPVPIPAPALVTAQVVPAQPPKPEPAAPRTPVMTTTAPGVLHYANYTGRLLVLQGSIMRRYASYLFGSSSALYTHGVAFGRQSETFKNAVYIGFGTEIGGPSETLQRYELSWQLTWAPLGTTSPLSPHLGFRLGGMMATSNDFFGSGSLMPGLVIAPQAGVDLQAGRHVVLTAGVGYDANLGPDMGPNASISGYSLDLGGTIRF
jgi:tetratricopeptide (TPR) repeat protein